MNLYKTVSGLTISLQYLHQNRSNLHYYGKTTSFNLRRDDASRRNVGSWFQATCCGFRFLHYTERHKSPLEALLHDGHTGQRGRATLRAISHHDSETGPVYPKYCSTVSYHDRRDVVYEAPQLLRFANKRSNNPKSFTRSGSAIPKTAERSIYCTLQSQDPFTMRSRTHKLGGRRLALCVLFGWVPLRYETG